MALIAVATTMLVATPTCQGSERDQCSSNQSCVGVHASAGGVVVDECGAPVFGVTVFFRPTGKPVQFATHAVTDAAGKFTDTVVPIGDVEVSTANPYKIVAGPTHLSTVSSQSYRVDLTVARERPGPPSALQCSFGTSSKFPNTGR